MALAVPSTDHAAGRIPKLAYFRKPYTKGISSCAPGRESDVLVRTTLPAKKGQVYFGRFYLGKRRAPALVRTHLLPVDRRRFRKYAANFGLAERTGVLR